MNRYLILEEVLAFHRLVLEKAGGSSGVRDLGALESALAQPRMEFSGQELSRGWGKRRHRWGSRWCVTTHS